jgi:hypothetical protein
VAHYLDAGRRKEMEEYPTGHDGDAQSGAEDARARHEQKNGGNEFGEAVCLKRPKFTQVEAMAIICVTAGADLEIAGVWQVQSGDLNR